MPYAFEGNMPRNAMMGLGSLGGIKSPFGGMPLGAPGRSGYGQPVKQPMRSMPPHNALLQFLMQNRIDPRHFGLGFRPY